MLALVVTVLLQSGVLVALPEEVPDVSGWPATMSSEGRTFLRFDVAPQSETIGPPHFRQYLQNRGACPEDEETCRVEIVYEFHSDNVLPSEAAQMVGQYFIAGPVGDFHGGLWFVRRPETFHLYAFEDGDWVELYQLTIQYFRQLDATIRIWEAASERETAPPMRR